MIPGVGGETIGLGQIVGQCGDQKPSIKAPIGGLFYGGCDAGGSGIGTQQAIESGMNVAAAVERCHRLRPGTAHRGQELDPGLPTRDYLFRSFERRPIEGVPRPNCPSSFGQWAEQERDRARKHIRELEGFC